MADAQGTRAVEDLHLQNLTKKFGDHAAVDDLTLTIPAGSFFALLGASGCGKTTTLRMVAGLEDPTAGTITIGDQDITGLRAFERPVTGVPQVVRVHDLNLQGRAKTRLLRGQGGGGAGCVP